MLCHHTMPMVLEISSLDSPMEDFLLGKGFANAHANLPAQWKELLWIIISSKMSAKGLSELLPVKLHIVIWTIPINPPCLTWTILFIPPLLKLYIIKVKWIKRDRQQRLNWHLSTDMHSLFLCTARVSWSLQPRRSLSPFASL